MTVIYNNTVFSPTAQITKCGSPDHIIDALHFAYVRAGVTLAQWQAQGNDPGTTANLLPPDEYILNWCGGRVRLIA